MTKIRWGIMSTGGIAHTVTQDILRTPNAEVVAVGSRSQASADAFGDTYNIPNRHATYETLVNDPDVDVVYIATPHAFHYENMKLTLDAGKHILCEKAFTLDAEQAREVVAIAREKGVFLMEAMWMRFNPAIREIQRLITSGAIGEVKYVRAEFHIPVKYDPSHRLFAKELGGGALLDLGIYPLSFAVVMLGFPDKVIASAQLGETGVDENSAFIFEYDNGIRAMLSCGSRSTSPHAAIIGGTTGYIRILEDFYHPGTFILKEGDAEPRTISMPIAGNGYGYEIEEVHRCLQAGATESPLMTLDDSIRMMAIMDDCRRQWGMTYLHEV